MTADVGQACAGLAALLPALATALTRDNTPAAGRPVLSAGGLVNPDVLHAMETLHREIPAARATACRLTGEPYAPRPLQVCLRAIPRLHDRLENLNMISHARDLEAAVTHWTRTVKLALGLRTRDQPIGDPPLCCPRHDEPATLYVLGAEGFLRDDHTVYWQYAARIWCPLCGESWDALQWPMLGRMLETA